MTQAGIDALIAARFLQAIGGSMLNPVALSIISQVFTGPVERARAIGVWGGVVGISIALGPTVGGLLIHAISWRAVFWINLPICLAAVVLTALRRRLDGVQKLVVRTVLPDADRAPRRLNESAVKADRMAMLRKQSWLFYAAVDALDLELLD